MIGLFLLMLAKNVVGENSSFGWKTEMVIFIFRRVEGLCSSIRVFMQCACDVRRKDIKKRNDKKMS